MKQTLVIFLAIILNSCLSDTKQTDYEYYEFISQKSLDGKYEIYKYCRTGMMAFSSDICGLQIQKAGTEFKENRGIRINGHLIKWISKDTLEVTRLKLGHRPKDTIARITYEKAYDLTLKVLNYNGNSGGNLRELYFDGLKIENEKMIFTNIRVKKDKPYKTAMTVNLGDLQIENKNDTIIKFIFEDLALSMNGTYKHSEDSTEINLPRIRRVTTYFHPTDIIKISELSNLNGIYINKKTTGNNGYK